jgi:hypothetical protein
VARLLFPILTTIHYRWINIITVDQPSKTSLTVTCLLFPILITIHYRWINIITVDQPSKMSLTMTRLQRRHRLDYTFLKLIVISSPIYSSMIHFFLLTHVFPPILFSDDSKKKFYVFFYIGVK